MSDMASERQRGGTEKHQEGGCGGEEKADDFASAKIHTDCTGETVLQGRKTEASGLRLFKTTTTEDTEYAEYGSKFGNQNLTIGPKVMRRLFCAPRLK
jgi:hypothetical protein